MFSSVRRVSSIVEVFDDMAKYLTNACFRARFKMIETRRLRSARSLGSHHDDTATLHCDRGVLDGFRPCTPDIVYTFFTDDSAPPIDIYPPATLSGSFTTDNSGNLLDYDFVFSNPNLTRRDTLPSTHRASSATRRSVQATQRSSSKL